MCLMQARKKISMNAKTEQVRYCSIYSHALITASDVWKKLKFILSLNKNSTALFSQSAATRTANVDDGTPIVALVQPKSKIDCRQMHQDMMA